MTEATREAQLLSAFVTLADSLVAGFDTIDLLQALVEKSTELFDAADAGIILANASNELEVLASTSERSRLIGLLQLGAGRGPCVEAFTSGRVVSVPNIRTTSERWPVFAEQALESGYLSVHAIPLRLRETSLGSLNLFREDTGALNEVDAVAAQALADVATISLLQERALRETDVAREHLQRALDSRVVIEQAKGVISFTHDVDMDAAFKVIREHARSHQIRLVDLSREIVDRTTVL
ncbi:MAG: transcriptional regulator [Frondihabitans sp.]|nr:transcriptional regulator [Frondihabitans sp.]